MNEYILAGAVGGGVLLLWLGWSKTANFIAGRKEQRKND